MASREEVNKAILIPMAQRYSPPRGMEDPKTVLQEYADDLAPFTRPELEKGWAVLRQSHERQTWPHFSEIRKAIRSAIPEQIVKPFHKPDPSQEYDHWYGHAENAPAYPAAVAAGVPLSFRNLAAKLKRWPQEREIAKCQSEWTAHLALMEELTTGPQPKPKGTLKLMPGIVSLGLAMIKRNADLIKNPEGENDE